RGSTAGWQPRGVPARAGWRANPGDHPLRRRLPRPQRHRVLCCDSQLIRSVFVDELSDVAYELMNVGRVPGGVHMNDRTIQVQRIPSLVDDARNQLIQRGSIGVPRMTFTGACRVGEALDE